MFVCKITMNKSYTFRLNEEGNFKNILFCHELSLDAGASLQFGTTYSASDESKQDQRSAEAK